MQPVRQLHIHYPNIAVHSAQELHVVLQLERFTFLAKPCDLGKPIYHIRHLCAELLRYLIELNLGVLHHVVE